MSHQGGELSGHTLGCFWISPTGHVRSWGISESILEHIIFKKINFTPFSVYLHSFAIWELRILNFMFMIMSPFFISKYVQFSFCFH